MLDPTEIQVEMQPGALIPEHELSLPVAMALAIPAARRLSMAALRLSLSH